MTDQEKQIMQAHAQYWRTQMEQGRVIVFGPVLEATGAWGLGVLKMESPAAVDAFAANDPAIQAGVGFRYEFHPMAAAVYRA